MVQTYLYCYLNYQKQNNKDRWKKLIHMPWYLTCPLFLSMLLIITSILLVVLNIRWYWIIELVAMILSIMSYFISDNYFVRISYSSLEKARNYYIGLAEWLKSIGIADENEIKTLKERVEKQISLTKEEQKSSSEKGDKWMQLLIIPAILSLISAIISQQNSFSEMMTYTFSMLFCVITIYAIIGVIRTLIRYPQKKQTNQLQMFADDLQSILDIGFKS